MLDNETKETAAIIGQFFLKKNNYDYIATAKELESLRINDLTVMYERIVIHTSRPGMLIGSRGSQISELSEWLGKKLHIVETKETILDYLVPQDPMDGADDLH